MSYIDRCQLTNLCRMCIYFQIATKDLEPEIQAATTETSLIYNKGL